jgi:hypothetical protein
LKRHLQVVVPQLLAFVFDASDSLLSPGIRQLQKDETVVLVNAIADCSPKKSVRSSRSIIA